jgi:hypothetical protein
MPRCLLRLEGKMKVEGLAYVKLISAVSTKTRKHLQQEDNPTGERKCQKLLVPLMTHHDGLGVTDSKKAAVGVIVLCVVLVWAVFPIFVESPDYVLALTVNPTMNNDCPTGSACFTLELRNRGPWPVTIETTELKVYPSLIGPSVNVNWSGSGPDRPLVLIPFTGHTYTFLIKIMGGLRPPDRVYVILGADVTVLYISHHFVLQWRTLAS